MIVVVPFGHGLFIGSVSDREPTPLILISQLSVPVANGILVSFVHPVTGSVVRFTVVGLLHIGFSSSATITSKVQAKLVFVPSLKVMETAFVPFSKTTALKSVVFPDISVPLAIVEPPLITV